MFGQCLQQPLRPQYGGGIIVNPELDDGLKGWSTFGNAKLVTRVSTEGNNNYIVAFQRNQPHDSFSQQIILEKEKLYTLSAWVQVSHGNADITAMIKTASGSYRLAGVVVARANCWSMLKGGIGVNSSGPAELYFESKNSSVDIFADSISIQPFTQQEWKSHQDYSVEKFRKTKVRLQAIDNQGKPLPNTTISIKQQGGGFPLGVAINKNILTNKAYEDWFASRFKFTTFENEMKWSSTEPSQGNENYGDPDAMLELTRRHNVAVRGHNVFWEDPNYQSWWLKSLSPPQLSAATLKRINSLVRRYSGKVIHWDVDNENLHSSFFTSKLGKEVSARFFKVVNYIDRHGIPFLNEFNTIETPSDQAVAPPKYLDKINELRGQGYTGPLGIGLQGHFEVPNLAYMRSGIDQLASTKLPIWITELDVKSNQNQAVVLEQVMREAHAHPAIGGIIVWSAWRPEGCYRMCLTDNNFRNLPTGDVVDKLLKEFGASVVQGTTNDDGYFEVNLFHGDYHVEINHPMSTNSTIKKFKVVPQGEFQATFQVTL
ncbi:metalloprotease [Lithospermum erythrorhizon]|uniref:Metalloprotease n=1 Tax=Lithospermum erythrorhizon TaxID=34254 RepID=A0AAV3QTW9_LITER